MKETGPRKARNIGGFAQVVPIMRHRLLFLLVPLALVVAVCSGGGADIALGTEVHGAFTTNAEGATISPDFTLTLANGELWTLAEQDTPTILLFWADW